MKERDSGGCQWSGPGQEGPQKPAARPDGRPGESKREKSRSESPARGGGEKAIIFTTFNLISFYTKIPRGSEEEEEH